MSQYFEAEPSARSARRTVPLTLPDVQVELVTDRAVFSPGQVDAGSKLLLLEGPEPDPTARVLADVGAGYGPITVTLAKRHPDATVWAIEINARARELTVENAARAGLTNVKVVAPDEVPADLVIDRIWSNPPIRIGKAALHELLTHWLGRLADDGSAHLVVQKHLGADSLQRWLGEQGWEVERRASRKAYRIFDVRRP